jgi:protein disulfide-isomerase
MKKIIVALLFAGSFAAEAQELVWETNVTKAMAISDETKKPLLLFFTGCDGADGVFVLKRGFKTPEFAT